MSGLQGPSSESLSPLRVDRLLKRRDFLAARNGARAHSRAFVVQLINRSGEKPQPHTLRIGFTVTKKVGNAVMRNRIKRRLRAAVAEAALPQKLGGHDAVIIARAEAANLVFTTLVADLEIALAKAHSKLSTTGILRPDGNTPQRRAGEALQKASTRGTSGTI